MTDSDVADVEATNDLLYTAFESGDLDAMAALWVDGSLAGMARCIHPGSEVIAGREGILRSWALLMANTNYLQFIVTEPGTVVDGNLAVVTCTENVLSSESDDDPLGAAKALATNSFIRVDGRWRIWLHHTSLVMPGRAMEEGGAG
jgi:ketosteroid isomerase-like protein